MTGDPKLMNIGPKSAKWLRAVGVHSMAQLQKAGSLKIYGKVRDAGFPATLNLLWALEGALQERPWFSFSPAEKAKLKKDLIPFKKQKSNNKL